MQFGKTNGELVKVTFAELTKLTNRVCNGLKELGIQSGTKIGVVLPMTVESTAIYFGIIKAGCVAVSIADSFCCTGD